MEGEAVASKPATPLSVSCDSDKLMSPCSVKHKPLVEPTQSQQGVRLQAREAKRVNTIWQNPK